MYMGYSLRIRELRASFRKSQQEIATILGTSQTMYARYERGANEMPLRHIVALAKYYDVCIDYLVGVTDNRNSFGGFEKR